MINPFQSHYHEGNPMSKEEKLRWEGFMLLMILEHEVKLESKPVYSAVAWCRIVQTLSTSIKNTFLHS